MLKRSPNVNLEVEELLKRSPNVDLEAEELPIESRGNKYKIIIIDFEGSPVFMCGLMVYNNVLTFYICDYSYRDELYIVIFEALKRAQELTFFAFSDHERLEILNMYQYLRVQGYNLKSYTFIQTLPIINLQRTKFESLTEALYSFNLDLPVLTGDVLFRNSKLVDKLFHAKKFQEIISHNRNCLINENIIFQRRWYKNYKI